MEYTLNPLRKFKIKDLNKFINSDKINKKYHLVNNNC